MLTTIIVVLALIALALYSISIFNKLVSFKNRYLNGFAQIEVQLKRRYDLIPGLVETAKAYLKHEKSTLEAVIEARNKAVDGLDNAASNPADSSAIQTLAKREKQLQGALQNLNLVVEDYPDLKANQTMQQLAEELTTTENRVAFARQAFNDAVTEYNSYRQSFPNIAIANQFGHTEDGTLLEFADSAEIQHAPQIAF